MTNYADWMWVNRFLIGNRTLKQVVLPGSHDAGMYDTPKCHGMATPATTKTQTHTIYDQLCCGSRYFDLRPIWYGGSRFRTGHFDSPGVGCFGGDVDDVLRDVRRFFDNGAKELVILVFSHDNVAKDVSGGFPWSTKVA